MKRIFSGVLVLCVAVAFVGCPPPKVPAISVAPESLDFGADEDQLTFEVCNSGAQGSTLDFKVEASADATWITAIQPITGTSTSPTDKKTITVDVDRTAVTRNAEGTITVSATGLEGGVTVDSVDITVTIEPVAVEDERKGEIVDEDGGTVTSDAGALIEIPPGELNQEVAFEVEDPPESAIRETLAEEVPYAGAVETDASRVNPNAPEAAAGEDFQMTVTVPLDSPVEPGTELDAYLKGDVLGEWIPLDVKAIVNPDGRTASFQTGRIGTFIVRVPDEYSDPLIDLDSMQEVEKGPYQPAVGYGLHRVENGGVGEIPIILVHGAGSYKQTQELGHDERPGKVYARWDNFIAWAKGSDGVGGTEDDGLDLTRYQLWWFLHYTPYPVGFDPMAFATPPDETPNNLKQLAEAIEARRNEGAFPDSNQQFIIIAHSRGGLVARSYVEKWPGAAEQVLAVITLATPHHGSPYAVPDWTFHTIWMHYSLPFLAAGLTVTPEDILRLIYAAEFKWDEPGAADLAWDNFDGTDPYDFGIPNRWFWLRTRWHGLLVELHHLTTNDAGWPLDPDVSDDDLHLPDLYATGRPDGTTLWDLNHSPNADAHLRKFILYAGLFDEPGGSPDDYADAIRHGYEHACLRGISGIMKSFESENDRVSHFAANDGMVPLQSALYLAGSPSEPIYATYRRAGIFYRIEKPLSLRCVARVQVPDYHWRIFSNYDHLDMIAGRLSDDDDTNDYDLFKAIRDDLDDTVASIPTANLVVASNQGGTVTIDASSSHDNSSDLWPATPASGLEYRVDWGENPSLTWSGWADSPAMAHVYHADRTYTITLQVRDEDGMIGTAAQEVPISGTVGEGTWQRTFGGTASDAAYSVQETSDGGYVLAGKTSSFGAGGGDMYLVKTDTNGNELWSRTFGGTDYDGAWSVQETSDGGYILAGSTKSFGAGSLDMYLVKTDANGDKLWSRTFGGTDSDWARSVQETSDGGYILAGGTGGAGSCDMYLVKTDADGHELWSRTFGGTGSDCAESVQETSDGGYILAGCTGSFGAGSGDMYLVKTDANGNELWSRTFGGTDCDEAWSVQETSDGGYILAGNTMSFGAGERDMYLVKTDANGNSPNPPE